MHAFGSMTERLREQPGSFGFVGLNGGFQSKYGAAIMSTTPREWPGCETKSVQEKLDAVPKAVLTEKPAGAGTVGTYTVVYAKADPVQAIVIGDLATGGRFIAESRDPATIAAMIERDPLGRTVTVTPDEKRNGFVLA